MTDVIFFDLDGTLVDHRSAVLETIGRVVRDAPDATAPTEELVALWWALEARHMREYLAGECSFAEHHRRRVRSFLPALGEPVPATPALLDAWVAERYLGPFAESWQCYPDVLPCLDALKPAAPGTATGRPHQRGPRPTARQARPVRPPGALRGRTDPDRTRHRQARRLRRRLPASMGTDPARAVNVGDMLESDVHAADRGLTGIWLDRGIDFVTGGPSPTPVEPVLRIESLADLPGQLTCDARRQRNATATSSSDRGHLS